jgi:biopolymer transport protein ExbD
MSGTTRRRGPIVDINVTPFVDIILVLLIIFMLTAHIIARQAIDIALPKASQGVAPTGPTLAVTLTRDGRMYLDGHGIDPDGFRAAVRAAVARDARTQVLVAGDKDVAHGRVVWVLDVVKSVGVTSFAIQIDPAGMVPPLAGG